MIAKPDIVSTSLHRVQCICLYCMNSVNGVCILVYTQCIFNVYRMTSVCVCVERERERRKEKRRKEKREKKRKERKRREYGECVPPPPTPCVVSTCVCCGDSTASTHTMGKHCGGQHTMRRCTVREEEQNYVRVYFVVICLIRGSCVIMQIDKIRW